jgi:TPP-dependent 2-oxoacid decarboxylase
MRLPEGSRFEIQFQAGSIGWSVPATLGYEMGFKTPTRVIAMIGDGSFQMTAQEVSTMIRHNTRPIIILVNNRGYIIEDAIHQGPYNKIKNWDYAGLMNVWTNGEGKGLGLYAHRSPGLQSRHARVGHPRSGGQRHAPPVVSRGSTGRNGQGPTRARAVSA